MPQERFHSGFRETYDHNTGRTFQVYWKPRTNINCGKCLGSGYVPKNRDEFYEKPRDLVPCDHKPD